MKKIKLLTGLFALSLTLISAHADTLDSQTIQAVLPAYVDIQAQTGTLQDGIDAQSGKLNNGFQSIFRITTNDPIKLHLSAKTQTDSGASEAFFQKGSDVYLILSHKDYKPALSSISDIKSGAASAINNPNAIAYPVSSVKLIGATEGEPVFVAQNSRYEFEVNQGETKAETTISPNVDSTTYSYDDRAGTYEAIITLTKATT